MGTEGWHRVEPVDVPGEGPVVRAVALLQVVQPVQVGAHLLGRGDLLDDPVDAVAAQAVPSL